MAFVQDLLASDDGLACTVDGLHCFWLQIQLLINKGKPRKAWLLCRRAISVAYVLGLHRQPKFPKDLQAKRNKDLWFFFAFCDRHLSLTLGLPYTALDYHFDSFDVEDGEVVTGWNHNLDTSSFLDTLKIDQELEEARASMSADWWALPASHIWSQSIRDMLIAKPCFHNDRKLLHLPYMLKSYTDRRYELSKINALESSREMIKYYNILRAAEPSLVCTLLDFQTFTASMILFINLCHRHKSADRFDPMQEESDWNLIHSILRDSAPSRSTESTSQIQTPVAFSSDALEFQVDPLLSFDSYPYELSRDPHPWHDIGTDWSSMFDLDLQYNWGHSVDAAKAK
ncbi:hypothetical protein MMC13_003602 [Lambiella insularis]|nr:hypothetical protein [Lambiella insularis]